MFKRKYELVVELSNYSKNRNINILDIKEMTSIAKEIYKNKTLKVSA